MDFFGEINVFDLVVVVGCVFAAFITFGLLVIDSPDEPLLSVGFALASVGFTFAYLYGRANGLP